jgi:hypothetical protein
MRLEEPANGLKTLVFLGGEKGYEVGAPMP